MKITTTLLIGIITMSFQSPYKPDITWSQKKLTREDFTLVKTLPNSRIAILNSGINLNINYNSTYKYRAFSNCNRNISVLIDTLSGQHLIDVINHEQRHFDITEYMTRCLNQQLLGVNDVNVAYKLFYQALDDLDTMQKQYDAQTEHYNDKAYQLMWNSKIDSLLNITKSY